MTALLSLVWLGLRTWAVMDAAVGAAGAGPVSGLSCPTAVQPWLNVGGRRLDEALVLVLAVSLAGALVLYRLPRRREQTSLVLVGLTALAITAASLGLAAYVPATDGSTPLLGPAAWVLALFLGNTTDSHLCSDPYPVGFEAAQVAAIIATGSGVVAGAGATWQAQWVRLRIRFASDLDVVVGLDELSIPLVKRLVAEADAWRRRDPEDPGRGRRRLLPSRPRVVVVTRQRSDSLIALARSAGAAVWVVDLRTRDAMRRLVLAPGLGTPRVAIRRMFVLGRDQVRNTELHDDAIEVMQGAKARHVRDVVPRIIVRMENPREAAGWRLAHIEMGEVKGEDDVVSWFSDAVSADEVIAHNLADLVEKKQKTTLALVGDSALTLALLEELSWRQWSRSVLLEASKEFAQDKDEDTYDESFRRSLEVESEPMALADVVLVSAAADDLHQEWRETRPALGAPRFDPFAVRPVEVVWSEGGAVFVRDDDETTNDPSLSDYLRGMDALVILTDSIAPYERDVLRASRRSGSQLLVAVPDPDTDGVGKEMVDGGLIRYGASWLTDGAVVEDSWGALARLRHATYRHRWVGGMRDPKVRTTGNWTLEGGRDELGSFFQSDNLRQLRQIVRAVERLGYTWKRMPGVGDGPRLSNDEVLVLARSEHERWLNLRKDHGWANAPTRDDRLRHHDKLIPWDRLDGKLQARNVEDVRTILRSLRAVGLVPTRHTHRRVGAVRAERLTEDRTWAESGGSPMLSRRGDWWVTEIDGTQGRGVARASFPNLYEPVKETPNEYRRRGEVMAWPGRAGEVISTLEGRLDLQDASSMVVFDDISCWAVPNDVFEATYEPIEEDAST